MEQEVALLLRMTILSYCAHTHKSPGITFTIPGLLLFVLRRVHNMERLQATPFPLMQRELIRQLQGIIGIAPIVHHPLPPGAGIINVSKIQ